MIQASSDAWIIERRRAGLAFIYTRQVLDQIFPSRLRAETVARRLRRPAATCTGRPLLMWRAAAAAADFILNEEVVVGELER